MRRLRAHAAALSLLGLMFPSARVVLVSLHQTEGHHHAASHEHVDGLDEAFHGHHHDDDTTPHDHPLVGYDFSAQRSRTLDGVVLPAALPAFSALICLPPPPALVLSRNIVTRDHGPPAASSVAILRI